MRCIDDALGTIDADRASPELTLIDADKKVAYGTIVSTMDLVQQIPSVKIGIATQRK